ncbi:hypothetical protein DPMN_016838 [Dreissena polymorpha]|uniref:Uncharacterized protein n=1 Tax=Dreissena polymorpha TaxID=45954 RepID=A0A9D4S7J3_DREPO|nr:hypothetical protein DPMN_016838 [Dreissena polymorpha]
MSMDNYLRPADVAVLCGGILASLVVGIVYAVKESRHESSSFRYHRGGGKLHPVPVAVSLVVTFESSISYLILPSDAYHRADCRIPDDVLHNYPIILSTTNHERLRVPTDAPRVQKSPTDVHVVG